MNARTDEVDTPALRVGRLRTAMAEAGLHAWIIPSADPHLSEYLPGRWQGRAWLSGFTGSVGTLVVTPRQAGLWVDSRYWSQAEAQLAGSGIALMKIQPGESQPHADWLARELGAGAQVGVDGAVLSVAADRALRRTLASVGAALHTDGDLLDAIWLDRPALPDDPVREHAAPWATVSRADKLAHVRRALREHGAQWHFVSTLDDIAWLFNLRGTDVSYNPVFIAHALVGEDTATLYVAPGKLPDVLVSALARDGITVEPYASAAVGLAALPGSSTLMVDPRRVTHGLLRAVPAAVHVVEGINPSTLLKACKNPAEATHVRATMEHDGAALCEVFAWLEEALGRETLTELTIDERLCEARARRPGFVSPSFGTIAAFNANAAMPHYRATADAHAVIAGDGVLLVDSGGQYVGGTTDITRVLPIGQPSAAQKHDYTLVLKGMIALSRARFPQGIRAPLLDAIARAPLWAAGADFGHGTGHGVGYFLNVHEGPQVISYHAAPEPQTAMQAGMITSIEPGIYRPGRWGIRIENLVLNRVAPSTEFGAFLEFETLTLCPIDTRCIDLALLEPAEIGWLDAYHREVRERLSPLVSGPALAWLAARTAPLADAVRAR